MRVKVGDKTWIFNPTCIMPVEDDSAAKAIPKLSRRDTIEDESGTSSDEDEGSGKTKFQVFLLDGKHD